MREDLKARFYPEARFGGFSDRDGTMQFYLRVNGLLRPDAIALDFGYGRGQVPDDTVRVRAGLRILQGKCAKVIGADIDIRASANPYVDEFRLLEGSVPWPFADASIELCVSNWVLEHMDDPDAFFGECARVLRPGGHLCLRTSHYHSYVAVLSRFPDRFHRLALQWAQPGRQRRDVFTTHYRCNTISNIRAKLTRHGFDHTVYGYSGDPSYLQRSRFLYFVRTLWERFAPSCARHSISVFARKP